MMQSPLFRTDEAIISADAPNSPTSHTRHSYGMKSPFSMVSSPTGGRGMSFHVGDVEVPPLLSLSDAVAATGMVGESEHEAAPWYKWPLFTWVDPLLARGSKRAREDASLKLTDMLRLPAMEDPRICQKRFRDVWDAEVRRAAKMAESPRLGVALLRAFGGRVLIGGALGAVSDGCSIASAMFLREFISWLEDERATPNVGWMWLGIIVCAQLVMSLTLNASNHHTYMGFMQMRAACVLELFETALRCRADAEATSKFVSAHSVDVEAFGDFAVVAHGIWISPLLIIASVIMLYVFVGYAGLICFGVLVVMSPLQGIIMSQLIRLRVAMLDLTDARIALLRECLQGIRIVKFMCWERFEGCHIKAARAAEVRVFATRQYWIATLRSVMQALPGALTCILIATALAIQGGQLKAADIYPAFTVLSVIRLPLIYLPSAYARFFDLCVALDRIRDALMDSSRHDFVHRHAVLDNAKLALQIDDVTLLGRHGTLAERLNLEISKGSFVVIYGPTAAGKSLLLRTMVGEVTMDHGAVRQYGSVAFAAQEPWIMNATVRQNIVMDQEFDVERYNAVLNVCELLADLAQLPAGDATELGECGANVSGGQRQRIALARAVYARADTILLDDVLSALDTHVASSIFDRCIMGYLRSTTRVLVTHHLQYMQHADLVVRMEHGQIQFVGTYERLIETGAMTPDAPPCTPLTANPPAAAEQLRIITHVASDSDSDAPTLDILEALSPHSPYSPGFAHTLDYIDGVDCVVSKSPIERSPCLSPDVGGEVQRPDPSPCALVVPEECAVGAVSGATYLWWMRHGEYARFAAMVAFAVIAQGFSCLSNLVLVLWTSSEPVIRGHVWSDFSYVGCMCGLWGIGCLAIVGRQAAFAAFVTKLAASVHDAMTTSVLRAPMYFFDMMPLGRSLSRFTRDLYTVDSVVPEFVASVTDDVLQLAEAAFFVCYSSAWLALMFPPLVAICVLIYRYYAATVRELKRLESMGRGPVMALLNESLHGLITIRVFGLEAMLRREHEARLIAAALPSYSLRAAQRWLSSRCELLGVVILFGVLLVGVLARTALAGSLHISAAAVALAVSNALSVTTVITGLTRSAASMEMEMSITDRVRGYADDLPREAELLYQGEPLADAFAPPAPPAHWFCDAAIDFLGADVAYRSDLPPVLKNLTFSIPAGSKVGVVGRSGSGKSTLLLALFRCIETSGGHISIGGRDIATIRLEDLRQAITIIPQDPLLFSGTIRRNLDACGTASDDDLWGVIDRLGLRPRFEQGDAAGLDTIVEEKGANFSLGQRQLICMARAMLKQSNILVLDEATASIDVETDEMIQKLIRTEFKRHTVITIAHRLATVVDADKILVLDAGSVREYDTPHELLARCDGILRSMVDRLGPEHLAQFQKIAAGHSMFSQDLLRVDSFFG